jgi:hypothetical protein
VYYALGKARRLYWRGIKDGTMPDGNEAIDIVDQAIEDVLSGRRAWHPTKQPALFAHLRSTVDSKLSHLVKSKENRRVRAISPPTDDGNPSEPSLPRRPGDTAVSPPDILMQAEEERLAEEFFWGFYELLDGEPILQKIVECIVDGIDKPAEVAAQVGVPRREIYNARKTLQRRLSDYRAARDQKPSPLGGGKSHG